MYMTNYIIHHNDADGYASAYLINTLPLLGETKFIEMDYSKDISNILEEINEEDSVFIVDFSLKLEQMDILLSKTKNVTWIDHHKTAISMYSNYDKLDLIKGIEFTGISGAGLTWLYLNGWKEKEFNELRNTSVSEEEMLEVLNKELEKAPTWLRLVDDWDVWKLKMEHSEHLNLAIANKLSIDLFREMDTCIERTEENILYSLIQKGINYAEYRDQWGKRFMSEYGFVINLEGNKIFCVNGGSLNSKYYGNLLKEYDAVMNFCYNSYRCKKFKVSIYSEKIDVSEIAKKYGGGGHPGASGFYFDDMNFIYDRMEEN